MSRLAWNCAHRSSSANAKRRTVATPSASLQALTAAALVLPGLILLTSNASADDDSVDFQYGHYEETKRNLFTVPNTMQPINVDSLHGGASFSLSDRIRFGFGYSEDTWSGATPIAVAPLVANSNRPIKVNTPSGVVVTGASPMITGQVTLNKNYQPLQTNAFGQVISQNSQVVDTMAFASPETRKQGNFELGYQWDEAELDGGAGISVEPDYQSRFANLNGRMDFNQKLTSLNLGLSYTNSQISAILDHDAAPYITKTAYLGDIQTHGSQLILYNNRQDWSTNLGLTQVVNKAGTFQANIGYTRSTGYLSNPYKVESVIFVDPRQQSASSTTLSGNMQALMEQRPSERNVVTFGSKYIQHIDVLNLDAALHLDYRFSHDDWGINAHTFEIEWGQPVGWGWSLTPRVRYYSQDAANFYQSYLISNQAYSTTHIGTNGTVTTTPFNPNLLPSYFSSDQRLSAFGSLSGGITASKRFAKGISLEAGFEYYTHKGSLKLGGGGEGSYADFNYWVANAALSLNFSALGSGATDHSEHSDHVDHTQHSAHVPSGVLIGHMMKKTDEVMFGYRFMYSRAAGTMLQGSTPVNNQTLLNNACAGNPCYNTASDMNMFMHMLDIMYAPTDWLNLMLMPQFAQMQMDMNALPGAPLPPSTIHVHTGSMDTGGVGDLGMYGLLALFDTPVHHAHLGLGISAPTGSVGLQMRRMHQLNEGYYSYGMQLGSGTWDFKPSLTYTGQSDEWSWGAQISGIKRLQSSNASGFAFGNELEATAWGGYHLLDWLSATVRCLYTVQGAIQGQYNSTAESTAPVDYPGNYGGRYVDMGFGLTAMVTGGELKGNVLGVEYLQPVHTDVNGYQLDRVGAVAATWSYSFDL